MNNQEKIISSLEQKGLLDAPSICRLRANLKRKLEKEAENNKKKMLSLKIELSTLSQSFN